MSARNKAIEAALHSLLRTIDPLQTTHIDSGGREVEVCGACRLHFSRGHKDDCGAEAARAALALPVVHDEVQTAIEHLITAAMDARDRPLSDPHPRSTARLEARRNITLAIEALRNALARNGS